jgi:hypothetical protein
VVDAGEYAVRGSVFDIYPTGLDHGLRLDFFGDELETLRLFDPNTQRSVQPVETHLLLPASEALLDEASIKRFRSRYRERFGANATGDPLYQAVSEGRRLAGMEHWLPLLEERMVTLFDHLAPGDLVVIDAAAAKAAETRLADIADYRQARTDSAARQPGHYRPLPEDALYLTRDEFDRALAGWPVHRTTLFAEPESTSVIDFGFASARDFTPDRAQASISTKRRPNIWPRWARAASSRSSRPIPPARARGSPRSWPKRASRRLPLPRHGRRRWVWPPQAARSRSCCRSKPGSPMPRSNSSPSRTFWATASCGARRSARTPTPSLPNSPRSRRAISSSTWTTASGATKASKRPPWARARTTACSLPMPGRQALYPGRKPRRALALWRRE